jgi:hypothetical protein
MQSSILRRSCGVTRGSLLNHERQQVAKVYVIHPRGLLFSGASAAMVSIRRFSSIAARGVVLAVKASGIGGP